MQKSPSITGSDIFSIDECQWKYWYLVVHEHLGNNNHQCINYAFGIEGILYFGGIVHFGTVYLHDI